MTAWQGWLDDLIGPPGRGPKRTLVVCRSKASLALVRRWAARRGGMLGLEATTLLGLARQVRQDPVFQGVPAEVKPELPLPIDSEIGRRIGGRPGLTNHARRWAQWVRATRKVGLDPVLVPWLAQLAGSDWGVDPEEEALGQLIEAVQQRGRALSASATWDRVVAIGFDRPAAALLPWEHALVAALTGRTPAAAPGQPQPLHAFVVPDVVAEARLAVHLARQDIESTLILVTGAATARRVRDALARSGLPCAYRDQEPLSVHTLASAIRRAATWFADAPNPPIHVTDLAFVLSCTALHRRLHPAAEAARAKLLEDFTPEEAGLRLGRRAVVRALEDSRLLDAPLSSWRDAMLARARTRTKDKPWLSVHAASIAVRLALLDATLTARPAEDAMAELLGEPLSFDADDFEDVLAQLIGEPTVRLAAPGTLGAVQRFLADCRVRVHDDPIARAILGALRQRADWPVTPSHVHHALSSTLDPGILSDGIDVMSVEDWDGRPCRQLIVLDVHDHGLARRAPPDPLLDDLAQQRMGTLTGREAVDERISQLYRAMAASTVTIGIVTRRDAGGREVVPPIQLDVRLAPTPPIASYGSPLDGLPEHRALVLRSVLGDAQVSEPPADPVVAHLRTQACVEWYRAGRGPQVTPPPHLARWLGDARGAPEAGLPPGPHAVTRLFRPLAHCPYQAFARRVLGIREPATVNADLDPREVGEAVHQALEWVIRGADFKVVAGVADATNDDLVDRLRKGTERAFDEAIGKLAALSEARRASALGRRDRYQAHWPLYVASRRQHSQPKTLDRFLDHHPASLAAAAAFRRIIPAAATLPDRRIADWLRLSAGMHPNALAVLAPVILLRDGERYGGLPRSCLPDLPTLLREPELLTLHRVIGQVRHRLEAYKLPPRQSLQELAFGPPDPEKPNELSIGPVVLRLGSEDIDVSGRVDRVDVFGTDKDPYIAVIDYKTGQRREAWQFAEEQLTVKDPQLAIYAMVLQRTGRDAEALEALRGGRVAIVAEDRVDHVVDKPEYAGTSADPSDTYMPVDTAWLGSVASRIGVWLDDARGGLWPLKPRDDTCPQLKSYGHDHCPIGPACRLRALPVSADADGNEP